MGGGGGGGGCKGCVSAIMSTSPQACMAVTHRDIYTHNYPSLVPRSPPLGQLLSLAGNRQFGDGWGGGLD